MIIILNLLLRRLIVGRSTLRLWMILEGFLHVDEIKMVNLVQGLFLMKQHLFILIKYLIKLVRFHVELLTL